MGLLGGASALALLGGSPASAASSVDDVNLLQPARSFAELLEPIPDAEKVLRAENAQSNDPAVSEERPMVVAQYYHHHHHHYHHVFQGTLTCRDDSYKGYWQDDKMHGKGTFTSSTGQVYTGSFKNGVPEGLGKLVTSDCTYVGTFLAGMALLLSSSSPF